MGKGHCGVVPGVAMTQDCTATSFHPSNWSFSILKRKMRKMRRKNEGDFAFAP